jgi:hypothetical protein
LEEEENDEVESNVYLQGELISDIDYLRNERDKNKILMEKL